MRIVCGVWVGVIILCIYAGIPPVCGDGMFMCVYVCMYVNFFSNAVASGLWYIVKEEGWSNEYLTTACATIG